MSTQLVREVVSDPEWLPHTYDSGGQALTFVQVPIKSRSELMFLSDEHFGDRFAKIALPADAVSAGMSGVPRAPLQFIFHTSFCCSTLLANALNVPGATSVLKEPDVLINLANRLIRSDDHANRQRVELVLRLLERPFAPGEAVVVKPTNFANRLLDVVIELRPNSRAILLYSDLRTFLRSLLKRGLFGRILGRKLFLQLKQWCPLNFAFSELELLEQTDVQIAALAWLMQIQHFRAAARAFGPRVTLLDSATLLAKPEASLDEAQSFFGLGLERGQVESIATGPVFARHSKFFHREYDSEAREQEHKAASEVHSEELEMVAQWIGAVAAQVGVPLRPDS